MTHDLVIKNVRIVRPKVRDVIAVDISEAENLKATLLFDAGNCYDERVLAEQFAS